MWEWREEMNIKTNRLLLRSFKETDFLDTLSIFEKEEVCRYLIHCPWSELNALDNFQKRIENNNLKKDTTIYIAVEYKEKIIGEISLTKTNRKDTLEIIYCFNPDYTNKGLASEAVKAVIDYFLLNTNTHRIQACLDCRNTDSQKLCERIGMRKEGEFKQDYWSKGEWTDSYIYGILKSDL